MKSITIMLLGVLLSSCSYNYLSKADKSIKNISLGMDKEQVIGIMGNLYLVHANTLNPENKNEQIISFKSSDEEEYRLRFIDDKLVSWNRLRFMELNQAPTVITHNL